MADLNAQLSISADASGVEAGVGKAKRSLADLGKTATTAGREAAAGLEGIGDGATRADAKVQRSASNLINSIQRTTAAVDAGSRSSSRYFETLAQQRGVDVATLRPYLQQLDQVNAKQAAATAELAKGGVAFNQYGLSARQSAAALRQVPAQLTDIIVGLQGGQAPLTVLLQQGGQLRDVFGGVVPAVRALGGAVLGLINPFTVAAVAVVGLLTAYERGRKESEVFARSLVLSGNAAGATVGQLQQFAQSIDAITGTQAAASAALAQFAASGAVAAGSLERFTTAALQFEKAGGGAVSETAKKFAELRRSPLEAVVKLNEGMNFLTRDIYLQIRALEEQGRTTEAAALAQRTFADTIASRSREIEQNLGLIERGWRGIKSAISEAVDAALNIGRTAGPEVQLQNAQKSVAALEALQNSRRSRGLATGDIDRQLDAARQLVDTQTETVRLGQRAAAGRAQEAASVKSLVEFGKLREQSLTNQEKRQREIAKATELARQAGVAQVELDKVIAGINERYKDPRGRDTSRGDARAQARLDIESIQSAAAAQINAVSNAERILDALRSAGLVSESAYYQEKRRLLEEDSRLKVKALQDENARLAQESLNKKDSLDRDREILKNQAEIAKLQAETATQSVILNAQEAAAIRQKAAALLAARQAQEDYLAAIERQQERELQSLGQGAQQRALIQGVGQIEDRYTGQRRDLENQRAQLEAEGKLTTEARQQFEARLALINEFQTKAVDSYRSYYQRLIDQQRNYNLGAQEALRNYFDESQNLFAQTEQLVSKALKGTEDALVQFVTTGKLSFTDLANSIVADISRIIIKQQVLGPLVKSLGLDGGRFGTPDFNPNAGGGIGSLISRGFSALFGGPRADGGPVSAGRLYEVNERNPELLNVGSRQYLMMGSQGGMVDANRGGNTITNVVLNYSAPPGGNRQTDLNNAASMRRVLERSGRNA